MQDLDWLCKKVIIEDTKEDIIEDDAEVEGEEDANNYAQVNSFENIMAYYYSNNFMEGYIVSMEQLMLLLNESSCVQELQ